MENISRKIRLSRDKTHGDILVIIEGKYTRYEIFHGIGHRQYVIILGQINFNISRTKNSISTNLLYVNTYK